MDKNVIVIDLDGTLTIENSHLAYPDKTENPAIVSALLNAKEAGYGITIATSRNMRTYQGDINKIKQFTQPIIETWLKEKAIPYDQLVVGKPWCGPSGFYVDDKNLHLDEFVFRFASVYSSQKVRVCFLKNNSEEISEKSPPSAELNEKLKRIFHLAQLEDMANYTLLISPNLSIDVYSIFASLLHKLNQSKQVKTFKINFYRLLDDESCSMVKENYIYFLCSAVAEKVISSEISIADCSVDWVLPYMYV